MNYFFFLNTRLFRVIVLACSVGFVVFYSIAALLYPGGSDFDHHSEHFMFSANYWCEVLIFYSKNGKPNPGRPYGLTSLILLNVTLCSVWLFFSLSQSKKHLLLLISGLASTFFANFLAGNNHDIFIALSVSLMVSSIIQLLFIIRVHSKILFLSGWFGLILILLNLFIYFFDILLMLLPILQKITFVFLLVWFNATLTIKNAHEKKQ